MIRFLAIFAVFIIGFTALFLPSQSYSLDLFFAPKRLYISDQKPITELRVTNTSNIARAYTVSVSDVVMTEEGVTTRVDGFEYSARRMIRYVPRQFDLQPGERQVVRIMARIPSDKPDGEYHSHLEFLENVSKREALNQSEDDAQSASAAAQVSYSTAIPVTLSKGEIQTNLDIENLSYETNENGEPVLTMTLLRSGNGQGNVLLDVEYMAPSGDVTKAGPRRHIYVYRELDRRDHKLGLQLVDGVSVEKGGRFKVSLFNKDVSATDPVKDVTLVID